MLFGQTWTQKVFVITAKAGRTASTCKPSAALKRVVVFEVSQILELAEAFLNLRVFQAFHAIQAKVFDIERSHHRSVDHRFAQSLIVQSGTFRKETDKAAGKGVTGTRRIENLL